MKDVRIRLGLLFTYLLLSGCNCGGEGELNRLKAQIAVEPASIDFGLARVGSETTRTVTIKNIGQVNVSLGDMALRDFASFQIVRGIETPLLRPSEAMEVEVSFVPGREGAHETELLIEADEVDDLFEVSLRGSAEIVRGACALEVSPSTLDFSAGDDQTFTARNVSTEGCEITAAAINGPAAAAFTFVGSTSIFIPSGGSTLAHLVFWPGANVSGQAELLLTTTDAAVPQKRIVLLAPSADRRLCVDPRRIHFSRANGTTTQTVRLSACGAAEVQVSALDFTVSNVEISIANTPALPMVIPVGQMRELSIQYTPENADEDRAVLTLRSNDDASPAIDVEIVGTPDIVPPDAGRFLYYWRVEGLTSDIMRAPLQSNGNAAVFWGQSTGQGCPGCHQVSPDGRYVAIVELDFQESLFVIDTMSNTKLTLDRRSSDAKTFSWRPNVNTNPPYQYVFSTDGELHTASLSGYIGELPGANDAREQQGMPAWGPNGKIAFVRGANDALFDGFGFEGQADLHIIDEGGGAAVALAGASGDGRAHYYPAFSPNGQWIAFTESASAINTYAAPDARVRIVKADGSGTTRELAAINAGGGATSFPTWSLDGTYLGFSSNRAGGVGDWDLYVAPIDPITGMDGAPANVTTANTSGFEHAAQWSP